MARAPRRLRTPEVGGPPAALIAYERERGRVVYLRIQSADLVRGRSPHRCRGGERARRARQPGQGAEHAGLARALRTGFCEPFVGGPEPLWEWYGGHGLERALDGPRPPREQGSGSRRNGAASAGGGASQPMRELLLGHLLGVRVAGVRGQLAALGHGAVDRCSPACASERSGARSTFRLCGVARVWQSFRRSSPCRC